MRSHTEGLTAYRGPKELPGDNQELIQLPATPACGAVEASTLIPTTLLNNNYFKHLQILFKQQQQKQFLAFSALGSPTWTCRTCTALTKNATAPDSLLLHKGKS